MASSASADNAAPAATAAPGTAAPRHLPRPRRGEHGSAARTTPAELTVLPARPTQAATSPAAPRRTLRRLRIAARITGLVTRKSVAVVLFLGLWEAAPRLNLVDPTFLVPFSQAVQALWDLLRQGLLWSDAEASLIRAGAGFAIALVVGVVLGLIIGWYRWVAEVLSPLLEIFRNTAALALLPVFVLVLGIGETSKIAIVAFACTWPVLLNTISAVQNVDHTQLKAARSLGLSTPMLFWRVVLPGAVPTIFSGVRLAASASILVLIAAEMVGAKDGLGYLINASQQNFLIPDMYAGIIAISLIGVLVNAVLVRLEKWLTRWRPAA